jgi:hypothetical protein
MMSHDGEQQGVVHSLQNRFFVIKLGQRSLCIFL